MKHLILVVDDCAESRQLLTAELEEVGFSVMDAPDGTIGWEIFQTRRFDCVVTDVRMPNGDGMALLHRLRGAESQDPQVPVVMVSAYGTLSTATDAGRSGADDFYPMSEAGIVGLVERVKKLVARRDVALPDVLLGESEGTVLARERVHALAPLRNPVLIEGEAGTGKRAVASYFHRLSTDAAETIAWLDASELGSREMTAPRSGTWVLTDVERLEPGRQHECLARIRELSEREGRRSVRVLATTNAELQSLAEAGRFDLALAQLLTRHVIRLPALAERKADIPKLAEAMIRRAGLEMGRPTATASAELGRWLASLRWPGNLAELHAVLSAAVSYAADGQVTVECVKRVRRERSGALKRIDGLRLLEEKDRLLALYRTHGTFAGMAEELGITPNGVKYRMKRLGLLSDDGAARPGEEETTEE